MPPSRCTVRRCSQVGTTVYPEQLDHIEPAFFLQQDLNCINIAICILRLLKVEHRPLCSPQLFCKHPLPHAVLLLSHPRARVGGRWGWGALLLLVFPGFRQTVGGRGRGGTGSPPSPSQSPTPPQEPAASRGLVGPAAVRHVGARLWQSAGSQWVGFATAACSAAKLMDEQPTDGTQWSPGSRC